MPRLTILTVGTRGDVQPYVALGQGLAAAGHQVRLATHEPFRSFVESHGLEFAPIAGDPQALMATPLGQQLLFGGKGLMGRQGALSAFKAFVQMTGQMQADHLRDSTEAARDADAVLCSLTAVFNGINLREAFGIPTICLPLQPVGPTKELYSVGQPPLPPGFNWLKNLGWYRWWQNMGAWFVGHLFSGPVNQARREILGLPAKYPVVSRHLFDGRLPFIYGISPMVVPRPSDWHPALQMAGYWFLDEPRNWTPPNDLRDFLSAGAPPVYFGFGSMREQQVEPLIALVSDALAQTGLRGVMATGWSAGECPPVPDNLFILKEAPHAWLFRRVAAVVHHGGAGTTAAGLRSGCPTIVVPYMMDQPYWGHRVADLGVGPRMIARKRLTAARLAEALRQATGDVNIKRRAAELGGAIRAESGVQTAIQLIEAYLDQPSQPGLTRAPHFRRAGATADVSR